MNPQAPSHVQQVKTFFESPQRYFGRRGFDVRIRVDTIQAFTQGERLEHILDIGCGNGDISLPLLDRCDCRSLTLLDVSGTMLELARAKIEPHDLKRVALVNDDFMAHAFEPASFDLIVCVGVLAHVDDPQALIEKIAGLLKPGGSLVVEVTDSYHPVGRALVIYHRLLGWFRPVPYRLNRLRIADIARVCRARGLKASSSFRYALPPPGSQRLFSHATLYNAVRATFGKAGSNRLRWLGNVALCRFYK